MSETNDKMNYQTYQASYHEVNFNLKYGWVCPRCETVYAPTVVKCECGKIKFSTTTTNTTEDDEYKWVRDYYNLD